MIPNVAVYSGAICNAIARGYNEAAGCMKEFLGLGGDFEELARCTPIATDILRAVRDLAIGAILPELAVLGYHVREAMKRYSLQEQRRLCDEGIPVYSHINGQTVLLSPTSLEFTDNVRRQVFGMDRIRTVDEQKVWLSARAKSDEPYIDGKTGMIVMPPSRRERRFQRGFEHTLPVR
jgi:hypothetical protein